MKKYLIIRILGNDLPTLHGDNQTYSNLEFTLRHEKEFEKTDKLYILNRIINTKKKNKIEEILKNYNTNYIHIPFEKKIFDKLPKLNYNLNQIKKMTHKKLTKLLYRYNLYIVNNNGSRNFAIEYGKQNNYEWTFVLDSNSFFTLKSYTDIISNIKKDSEYLIIPQKRLHDNNLNNMILINKNKNLETILDALPVQEPQIAFKNTSKYKFNENIPYGLAPKAEFLCALRIPGKWNKWMFFYGLNIKKRTFKKSKYQILSKIIRLHPKNKHNTFSNNWILRNYGIFILAKNIQNF